MKNLTFSRIKLKNYFLALTYFLFGIFLSNKIPTNFLFIIIGIYLTVGFFHVKEMFKARTKHRHHEQNKEWDSNDSKSF
ncbi:hypothetical protein [Enterococcus termitis]|uniref:Uncharacterized protein n=1 Tax=Enterococcus termitis TaxID=332950 RepID=A0A1E5GID8_9ENTE|nr:hypothetical protein [Enterococcus termitis]OEG12493.1 hypothetical protein BCR25_08120 [Enterococcus termitis]